MCRVSCPLHLHVRGTFCCSVQRRVHDGCLIKGARTRTFVDDRHFEWYADNSHEVLCWHQRAQDCTDTQSFTFPLVDELGKRSTRENEKKLCNIKQIQKHEISEKYIHAFLGRNVPKDQ